MLLVGIPSMLTRLHSVRFSYKTLVKPTSGYFDKSYEKTLQRPEV